MHAKMKLKYFLNYRMFTHVCAIDPGVYVIINWVTKIHQFCLFKMRINLLTIQQTFIGNLFFSKHLATDWWQKDV
jgi:hypothetical protein